MRMRSVFLRVVFAVLLAAVGAGAQEEGPEASGMEVAVMSFNLRYATRSDGENRWRARKDFVAEVIREAAVDVVGLQEALRRQLDDLGEALPEYGEIGTGRDGGEKGEYSAILYRKERFAVEDSGTFWLSDTPGEPSITWGNACVRICTWARLRDKESGRAFYLYNTHLDHQSQPSREKSVRLIARRMAARAHPDPVVLSGDFNAGEKNSALTWLTGGAENPVPLRDSFRVKNPDAREVGTFNGFRGDAQGAKIDYILVEPETRVREAAIVRTSKDGRFPSDHFPVTARLEIRAEKVAAD